MRHRRITEIEINFGVRGYPDVYFHTTTIEHKNGSRRFQFASQDEIVKLEHLTENWPCYIDIPNKRVLLKRPGFDNEFLYEEACSRVEALMDAPPGSSDEGKLSKLSFLVECYEDIHYPIHE